MKYFLDLKTINFFPTTEEKFILPAKRNMEDLLNAEAFYSKTFGNTTIECVMKMAMTLHSDYLEAFEKESFDHMSWFGVKVADQFAKEYLESKGVCTAWIYSIEFEFSFDEDA